MRPAFVNSVLVKICAALGSLAKVGITFSTLAIGLSRAWAAAIERGNSTAHSCQRRRRHDRRHCRDATDQAEGPQQMPARP